MKHCVAAYLRREGIPAASSQRGRAGQRKQAKKSWLGILAKRPKYIDHLIASQPGIDAKLAARPLSSFPVSRECIRQNTRRTKKLINAGMTPENVWTGNWSGCWQTKWNVEKATP